MSVSVFYAKTPPSPDNVSAQKSASANGTNTILADDDGDGIDDDIDQEPLPINQNLIYLIIGGVVLGTTVIYRNKIKKASM